MTFSATAQTKSEKTCYDSAQIKQISDFKKDCDLYKLNYQSSENALQSCLADTQCSKSWTEDKMVVGAGFLTSLLVGIIVASAMKK